MSAIWERVFDGALAHWLSGPSGKLLRVGRLPRSAWPLVVSAVARASSNQSRSILVLVPGPARFLSELRQWLAGSPPAYLFAVVTVSFLDRPPAFDEAVARRLEAVAALSVEPCVVVSSRKAMMRTTVSPAGLAAATVVLRPGLRADPTQLTARLVELGYSREPLAEGAGQFSLRGGILDVFPASARAPVRAEFLGDEIETLRLFDVENQRSIMAVPQVTVRPGREVLLGPQRGVAAAERVRARAALDGLRADVRSEWEDELERLEGGGPFPGVELFAAYLEPAMPSLLDHLAADAVVVDLEPERQIAEARQLEQETVMLAEAEAGDGELPRGFTPPMVRVDRLSEFGERSRLEARVSEAVSGGGEDVDLGWTDLEALVGRPRAVLELAERAAAGTVVLASEQKERVEALLMESGVSADLVPVDLGADLELSTGLHVAEEDVALGCSNPGLGFYLYSDAEMFGRVRRPSVRPARRGSHLSLPPRTAGRARLPGRD